ncbi:hypothetical protein B0A55_04583 [Friedmanniomyces simplex]|uniref:BTB domain-containing protein n=1 Tax=Friedmanniomyces simplex TaxID=329884 RepID=A0A4U0XH68_9PEZI|nr:hypothetical protein B0A55_04583 [Friedmanniomyces simplex]
MADSTHTLFQEQYEGRPLIHAGLDEYDPPPHLSRDYRHSSSPFSLDSAPTNEQSFLEWYPKGNATLTFPGHDGELQSIGGIAPWVIESRCPLLAMAFEDSRSGPQLHLEALSQPAAWPLLRYLYTGSYALTTAAGHYFEDVPTSVLLHCRLYRLADIYALPELRSEAYLNVLRQCEFGCSSPNKPIDLCDAIRFVYGHLQEHEQLIDAIVNYCVSCFQRHRLGEDEQFKELAYTIRPFHQALCRNSMGREFENETAAAIIQLPYLTYRFGEYASHEESAPRYDDVVYHFHCNDDIEEASKKRKHEIIPSTSRMSAMALALRPKTSSASRFGDPATLDNEPDLLLQETINFAAGDTGQEGTPSSDEDYDIVARPAAVEVVSTDDETDSGAEAIPQPLCSASYDEARSLPSRSRSAAASTVVVPADSDSDPDWTVV